MRPIPDPAHKPMLDGIDVTILHITRIVRVVSDQMFPEPALPDAALAARLPNRAAPLLLRTRFREARLDEAPPGGEIGIFGRQTQDCMHVIRQDDHRFNIERELLTRRGHGSTKYVARCSALCFPWRGCSGLRKR